MADKYKSKYWMIDTKFAEDFYKRLRELSDATGESVAKQAEAMGLNAETVNSWIKGKRMPNAAAIPKLCRYYGVSAQYLLCMTNRKRSSNVSKDNERAVPEMQAQEALQAGRLLDQEGMRGWNGSEKRNREDVLGRAVPCIRKKVM